VHQFLELLGSFCLVFCFGYGITYVFVAMRNKHDLSKRQPLENAKVRFKTSTNLYRTRLLEAGNVEWVFAAPLQRDSYVPIPIGIEIVCEVVARGGVLIFTSIVTDRDSDRGAIMIKAPVSPKLMDRRDEIRRVDIPMQLLVGGSTGEVMDLSAGGARIKIRGYEREGKVINIELPHGENRKATVVDTHNSETGSVIRLKFDRPIALPE
jgi:hypothetical protein